MSKSGKKTKAKQDQKDWSGRKNPDPEYIDDLRPEELAARFGTIKGTLPSSFPPGTLTVAMIVKDEAANIRAAVESFRPIADEIMVFDTGSQDGTQAILDTLGVKWTQGEWRGDFAWARNRSIEAANCAWILWMDADDRIPADQLENFRKLKTAPLDRAFGFQVINTQGGLPLGSRFMQLRMFPNHPAIRFRYKVHEQLFHSVAKLGLHCFFTDTTIHHTGYEDADLKQKKALRNLLLLEEDPERVSREPSLAMAMGDSHYILGDYAKGIEAYRRTMEMPNCREINKDIYNELPSLIGRGYQKLGRREEALPWFDKTIALAPEKHEAYYYKAECLMEMNRPADAEPIYAKLAEMPVSYSTTSNQYDVVQIYSHYNLAQFRFDRGDYKGALERVGILNAKYPQVVEGWQLLGKCQVALGDGEAAIKSWAKAITLNPKALPELHAHRLGLLKRFGRKEEFEESLAAARGCFPGIRFAAWEELPAASMRSGIPAPAIHAAPAMPNASADALTSFASSASPDPTRPALSLCMIVKNEKDNLPACLDSVRDLAGEIIIVDTGSNDGTQDIARSFGAQVVQSDWRGDFSLARNQSLAAASGRWILWLDADDRMLEEDKRAIRKLAEADPDRSPKAYGLMVKNSRDGGLTGSVFNQIRIFPNRPDLRFRAPVHEQILPALEEARVPVEYLAVRVLHTGYADPAVAKAKQVRNKAILEAQIKEGKGITPVTYYTLASACLDLELPGEAIEWFLKAAEAAEEDGSDPHVLAAVPAKVAGALASLKQFEAALEILEPELSGRKGNQPVGGAADGPAQGAGTPGPEAVLVKAQVEAALGRPEKARPWFERLLALNESGTFIPIDFQLLKIQALQFLGQYWYERKQPDLAVFLLKAGLAIKDGKPFGAPDLQAVYRRFQVG